MTPHPFWSRCEDSSFNDRYFLKKLLGVGAFGAVFQAEDRIAAGGVRPVAIKIFDPMQAISVDRMIQELEIAITCQHPWVIDCYSFETGKLMQAFDGFGLVMELAEESLDRRLTQGLLPVAEAIRVIQNLAMALAHLHDRRIVHRDLKPANVLRVGEQWKLGDLGIVRVLGDRTSASTQPSNQVGTVAYMPPESFNGKINPGWDVWSLGVMMVELLTGHRPFPGQTFQELIAQVLHNEPQILPSLPASYQSVVQGCLMKDYQQRWTAQQVLTAMVGDSGGSKLEVLVLPLEASRLPTFQAYQETLGKGIILDMVAIPGGEFLMGSPPGEGHDREHPYHPVEILGFLMGKYVVTNAQWRFVMETDPAKVYDQSFAGDRQPVVCVSWNQAVMFCQKLSQLTGRQYRLPSEAEWEYACRAKSQSRYYFGDDEQRLKDYGWYQDNSNGQTHAVGEKLPNEFGLYDMHGNVWEWCEDNWHDTYNNAPREGRAWVDSSGTRVVVRGGSWYNPPGICRSSSRDYYSPVYEVSLLGFRVVCSSA